MLRYMKYLIRSFKRSVKAVGIRTEENWYVKRVNAVYTIVCERFNFKINKRFDSLRWSSFSRYLYKLGTIAGLESAKEEEIESLFPFGVYNFSRLLRVS